MSGNEINKPAKRVRRATADWQGLRAEFVEAQAGKCPICQERLDAPHLDHCHETGFIRGALCSSCNGKLGWFEKHRHDIDAYLAHAAEFTAYQIADRVRPKRYLPLKRMGRRDTREWLRDYWREKGRDIPEQPGTPQEPVDLL